MKKILISAIALFAALCLLVSCGKKEAASKSNSSGVKDGTALDSEIYTESADFENSSCTDFEESSLEATTDSDIESAPEDEEEISVSESEIRYSYALGLKSLQKSGGAIYVKGVSVNCDIDSLKQRAEKLFESGDTALNLVLDENFTIQGVEEELLAQGYVISVDKDITVTAATELGLYYGARTVSDYAKLQGCMEKGVYTDWPDVKERCLHFDIARKYFTKDFIIGMIEDAAATKMNAVELHFSENEGFRIECETDPQIMSDEYLTKDEVREILAAAKELYVEIIPSFDTPGHLLQVLKAHPEYSLTDVDGYNSPKTLDITNPEAVAYIKSLLDEYAELFAECKFFNIGGDESFGWSDISRMQFGAWKILENYAKDTYGAEANAHDSFVGYINDIGGYMMEKGFTVRAWNDGLRRVMDQAAMVEPDPHIEICYWSNNGTLRAAGVDSFLSTGHNVYNVNEEYMYYVLKDDYKQPKATAIFKEWNAGVFPDTGSHYKAVEEVGEQLKGAYFCIWCDRPNTQTPEEVRKGSIRPLAAMAVKSWNSDPHIDYTDFATQFNILVGE